MVSPGWRTARKLTSTLSEGVGLGSVGGRAKSWVVSTALGGLTGDVRIWSRVFLDLRFGMARVGS